MSQVSTSSYSYSFLAFFRRIHIKFFGDRLEIYLVEKEKVQTKGASDVLTASEVLLSQISIN